MSETILYEGMANLFKGIESVGGKLYLTENQVIHKPHGVNIQGKETTIFLNEIEQISLRNTMGVVPNGLLIKTKEKEYKFVVNKRKTWLQKIEETKKDS